MLFTGVTNRLLALDGNTALITTIFGQSAVSMLGFGILSRVVKSQSQEKPAMSIPFAFDLVSYSFPLSIILNTSACIMKERYVNNLIPMGGGLLVIVLALFFAKKKAVTNKEAWVSSLEPEKAA